MSLNDGDEEAQIRAAKADPKHFAPLYERYFNDVFRFLYRRAGHRELTADLTQQTFLKAMLGLDRFESRGSPFRAWLYRIALNEVRMHWRKRKEVVMQLRSDDMKELVAECNLGSELEEEQRVIQALGQLKEDQAKLIEMRYFDGLSFLELGQVLDIAEDAAKMRTHRVLGTLRAYLAKKA